MRHSNIKNLSLDEKKNIAMNRNKWQIETTEHIYKINHHRE